MAFLLVTLLVVLYSFQSLFLKLFSAKYPAEKSALASTVFNISYGAFAGITTLCAMGFRFSASKVTLICGLVNAVTLLCYNVSMIQASRKGSYAFQMIAMLFGGIVVPMLHSVIFLGDRLSLLQCLAVALMLVSFVLMNLQGLSLKGSGKSFLLWCLALFFSNGLYGILMNYQQLRMNGAERNEMIVLTYLGMAVLCALFQGAKDAKGLARGFKMPARPLIFLLACCLCATLASRSFQRGVYVFGAALVISYVTFFMVNVLNFPSDMLIWFGILHMLGVCMMLFPLFKRLPVWALAVLGVGFVALGVWFESFCIPVNFLFPLGLRAQGFYCGGDYFPLLPGFGWFLLGAVIGRTAYRKKQSLLPRVNAANPVIRFFSFCGRHSLLIYMLHQPVLTIGTILIFG